MKEKSKKSQKNDIVKYLETNPGATNYQMTVALRIGSTSKRLSELMQLGIVESIPCDELNEEGKVVSQYCRYYLKGVLA